MLLSPNKRLETDDRFRHADYKSDLVAKGNF
jgi:hypothetical protein